MNFLFALLLLSPVPVQEHNHPHILLLQIGNTFCKLPGGRLKPGENGIEGLKRKLTSKLEANSPALVPDWQISCANKKQFLRVAHQDERRSYSMKEREVEYDEEGRSDRQACLEALMLL
ncbi:hypothetical protein F3Y22_tig00110044pilonHSYRG00013 [Hibiscus syriacus]|uniref:Uncharacterized protein n=1 Tax=Hibiscus syriacus TaxID=106335 RepID=A0A6A3BM95_HIBSY|nr:hypothetical protein F3Y22_tig00110044pilonHSYRG00013 [Hibiscus syriacus]